jgi:hypothetical protein
MRRRSNGKPAFFAKIERKTPRKGDLVIGEERESKYYLERIAP